MITRETTKVAINCEKSEPARAMKQKPEPSTAAITESTLRVVAPSMRSRLMQQ